MIKVANVVFAYIPKNDDELELQVGDRVEVIGPEEEGWWRGKLKGKIGVFPTNFVELIETTSNDNSSSQEIDSIKEPTSLLYTPPPNSNNNNNIVTSTANKLTSLFANKHQIDSKINSYNQNINNYTMNQQQDGKNEDTLNSIERRPKPLRSGYGDIFAAAGVKSKLLPAEPTNTTQNTANERLSTGNMLTNVLQIPKKPPPPAPLTSETDPAPALPPKPISLFSPPQQQQQAKLLYPHQQITPQVREQAKVIYKYEPTNEDELAMDVGDIIDIIDKNIEDAGWWKGELRGKIGVFPDNFVELINNPITTEQHTTPPNLSNRTTVPNLIQSNITENKLKPVFASTPKEFRKELENNILQQQHNNNSPTSLLSLKKNKQQQQQQVSSITSAIEATNQNGKDNNQMNSSSSSNNSSNNLNTSDQSNKKLNHITANRAKGPARRPPSNILNKRTQPDYQPMKLNGKPDEQVFSISSTSNLELDELKAELRQLRDDFDSFVDLKNVVEVMKTELKSCQSAIESQKKYIKDLVNNLADERKKIAMMQDEIDRNLK